MTPSRNLHKTSKPKVRYKLAVDRLAIEGSLIGIKENEIGNTDTHVLKDSLFKTFEKGNTETYDFFKLRDTAYINLTQNKWDQRTHPQQIFWTFFVRAHSNGNISFWGTEEDENNGFGENLYIIDSNGENRKKIFNYPEGVYGAGANMLEYDISEDGKWLLFSLDGDIVLIELENPENTINLTNSKDQIDIFLSLILTILKSFTVAEMGNISTFLQWILMEKTNKCILPVKTITYKVGIN